MKPPRFIWFHRLEGPGEEALDLYKCRRFVLTIYNPSQNDPDSFADFGLTYYMTPDGRWIEHRVDEDYQEFDGKMEFMITDSIRECDPRTAAHEIMNHKPYRSKLPKELEAFRDFGDFSKYQEWFSESHSPTSSNTAAKPPLIPHWDKEARRVVLGSHVCKRFNRTAPAQEKILDCFELQSWTRSIVIPLTKRSGLKDTVDSMNKWPDSLIFFRKNGNEVAWSINRDKAKSAKIR